jgi:multidrug resistance efflux pump
VNTNLLNSPTLSANGDSPRTTVRLAASTNKTPPNGFVRPGELTPGVIHSPVVRAPVPAPAAPAASVEAPELNARHILFRSLRLIVAAALVTCAAMYARTALTVTRSERAYINAEITPLRAPIAGQVRIESFAPGEMIRASSPLFSIENARFGNEQALAQLNWATESAERLHAEADEAAVRLRHQEEVARLHEKMFAEQIIPRMQLIEEQSKRDLNAAVLSNKLALAQKAAQRVAELTKQSQLQQAAAVTMPFDGVAWASPAKNGAQIAVHEPVVEVINPQQIWVDSFFSERHARKLKVGAEVKIETPRGELIGRGAVETVRAGVGRIPFERIAAVSPVEYVAQRIAVRVRLNSATPFHSSEFFGVGRSVIVTLNSHNDE